MKITDSDIAEIHDWLEPVIDIGHEAGARILDVYRTDFSVRHKEDDTPLTRADMAAHRTIVDALGTLTPDLPVLSEESAQVPYSKRRTWGRYWLVDPLDGTKEFIKRNDEFTVNIALIQGDQSVLGVVHGPAIGETWYAARGCGAFRMHDAADPVPIHVRKLGTGPVVVAGSRSHAGARLREYLDALGDHELLSVGSSIKLCLVAEGRADIYVRLGLTSEWDTAAAQCVVEESGGQVTTTDLRPLRYNTKESLLNPEFFAFGDASRDWSGYLGSRRTTPGG